MSIKEAVGFTLAYEFYYLAFTSFFGVSDIQRIKKIKNAEQSTFCAVNNRLQIES